MKPCGVCGVVCRVIVCYRSSLSRVARCVVHDCFSSEHLARSKTHGKGEPQGMRGLSKPQP